jgi:uncharacterized protein
MSISAPHLASQASPHPTSLSRPFWDGCRDHKLLFQRCSHCHRSNFDPAPVCPWCRTNTLEWEESSGTGSIYSWSVVWQAPTPAFVVPYVAIIAKLLEDFYMVSDLVHADPSELRMDLPIVVKFEDFDDFTLPYFQPSATIGSPKE